MSYAKDHGNRAESFYRDLRRALRAEGHPGIGRIAAGTYLARGYTPHRACVAVVAVRLPEAKPWSVPPGWESIR